MAVRYLLDTDICIYLAKYSSPLIVARLSQEPADSVSISVITLGELHFGAEKSAQRDRALRTLAEFSEAVTVLPLPPMAAMTYGSIRDELQRAGTPIGANDLWIAAHALALDLTLVSNNIKEFRRVSGLRVENWAQ